jgi:hypothetical protein
MIYTLDFPIWHNPEHGWALSPDNNSLTNAKFAISLYPAAVIEMQRGSPGCAFEPAPQSIHFVRLTKRFVSLAPQQRKFDGSNY